MQEPSLDTTGAIDTSTSSCPFAHKISLEPSDTLVFPYHKRAVLHYVHDEAGQPVLYLHHRERAIVFDDPALFGFGETLANTARFVAESATRWGDGQAWSRVKELLEQLIEAGVLQHETLAPPRHQRAQGPVASPLTEASTVEPHTWLECASLSQALGGRAIDLGHLEIVLPVYRIAHPTLDAEGRQVGEANVFPPALRLDIPTEWRTCQYAGSRFQDDYPMNVTALKAMIKHWKPMLACLAMIRAEYVRRPGRQGVLSVGDVQRLSTLALAVPAYLMLRSEGRTPNGALHPVWSSIFRICDGLRMATHEMLFTPTDGKTRSAESLLRGDEIYPYAERKQLLLSEHGVCAGPKALIEEFVHAFVDGQNAAVVAAFQPDATLAADLMQLSAALDYGLQALQVYAVAFSLWPQVGATHECLLNLLGAESFDDSQPIGAWQRRLQQDWPRFPIGFLPDAEARATRMRAHSDMYAGCARALGSAPAELERDLAGLAADSSELAGLGAQLRELLAPAHENTELLDALARTLAEHFSRERALVRLTEQLQAKVNRTLGRALPAQPLTAADLAFHHRLRVALELPYLSDSLRETLGIAVTIDAHTIALSAAARSSR